MTSQAKPIDLSAQIYKNFQELVFKKAAPSKAKTGKPEYKLSGASTNFGPKNRGIRDKDGKIVHQLAPGQVVDWKHFVDPETKQSAFSDADIRELTKVDNADYFIYDMFYRVAGWKSDVIKYVSAVDPENAKSQTLLSGQYWITGANFKDENGLVGVTRYWYVDDKKNVSIVQAQGGAEQKRPMDLIAWEKAAISLGAAGGRVAKETPLPLNALPEIAAAVQKITGSMMADMIKATAEALKKKTTAAKTFIYKKKPIPNVEYEPRQPRAGGAHGVSIGERLRDVIAYNTIHTDPTAWQYVEVSAADGRGKVINASEIDTETSATAAEKGKRRTRLRIPLSNYVPANKRVENQFKYLAFNVSFSTETGKFKYEDELRTALRSLGLDSSIEGILAALPKDRKGRAPRAKTTEETTEETASTPSEPIMNMNIPIIAAARRVA